MATSDKISHECYYEQLISVRNLEIDQFWKRNVFIFGIQGVIISFFIGSFSTLMNNQYTVILIISNIFGFCLAVFCLLIINTDRLWLKYYEDKVEAFEIKMNEKIVKESDNNVEESDLIAIFCDNNREELKKDITYFSTKTTMIWISCLFIAFWVGIFPFMMYFIVLNTFMLNYNISEINLSFNLIYSIP